MAPHVVVPTGVLFENDTEFQTEHIPEEDVQPEKRKVEIVWRNVIYLAILHLIGLYGCYLIFTKAKLQTIIFDYTILYLSFIGVTAGSHRLWTHRTYKAKWPLVLLLTIFNTLAFQFSIIYWSRDHRVHHKYSETDADPHNSNRGFFFAHIGWFCCRKHPEVIAKGKRMDISDLYADPIVAFQHKYYWYLMPVIAFILPSVIPVIFWKESFLTASTVNVTRWLINSHFVWFINSWAHMYGNKPFDKNIKPTESWVLAFLTLGEGWHNYHHTFPWDYKTGELGHYSLNNATAFIDFFAKIGWAYDLKSVPENIIETRAKRTGDGSHALWGWGDKDQSKKDYDEAVITYRRNSKIN